MGIELALNQYFDVILLDLTLADIDVGYKLEAKLEVKLEVKQ
jgi:hypothetical protein